MPRGKFLQPKTRKGYITSTGKVVPPHQQGYWVGRKEEDLTKNRESAKSAEDLLLNSSNPHVVNTALNTWEYSFARSQDPKQVTEHIDDMVNELFEPKEAPAEFREKAHGHAIWALSEHLKDPFIFGGKPIVYRERFNGVQFGDLFAKLSQPQREIHFSTTIKGAHDNYLVVQRALTSLYHEKLLSEAGAEIERIDPWRLRARLIDPTPLTNPRLGKTAVTILGITHRNKLEAFRDGYIPPIDEIPYLPPHLLFQTNSRYRQIYHTFRTLFGNTKVRKEVLAYAIAYADSVASGKNQAVNTAAELMMLAHIGDLLNRPVPHYGSLKHVAERIYKNLDDFEAYSSEPEAVHYYLYNSNIAGYINEEGIEPKEALMARWRKRQELLFNPSRTLLAERVELIKKYGLEGAIRQLFKGYPSAARVLFGKEVAEISPKEEYFTKIFGVAESAAIALFFDPSSFTQQLKLLRDGIKNVETKVEQPPSIEVIFSTHPADILRMAASPFCQSCQTFAALDVRFPSALSRVMQSDPRATVVFKNFKGNTINETTMARASLHTDFADQRFHHMEHGKVYSSKTQAIAYAKVLRQEVDKIERRLAEEPDAAKSEAVSVLLEDRKAKLAKVEAMIKSADRARAEIESLLTVLGVKDKLSLSKNSTQKSYLYGA